MVLFTCAPLRAAQFLVEVHPKRLGGSEEPFSFGSKLCAVLHRTDVDIENGLDVSDLLATKEVARPHPEEFILLIRKVLQRMGRMLHFVDVLLQGLGVLRRMRREGPRRLRIPALCRRGEYMRIYGRGSPGQDVLWRSRVSLSIWDVGGCKSGFEWDTLRYGGGKKEDAGRTIVSLQCPFIMSQRARTPAYQQSRHIARCECLRARGAGTLTLPRRASPIIQRDYN
ncbi:hypothetical protein CALVIDRAFT_382440 [Calocera viscosa TUFC12733]|uniref:Uncharacterized protein n=1 Tax=Calocera viscosa (strain TUFC12733) TaxID=1330018 RepID=A0A167Q6F2_CALVF|nr:hypothetical protein CALVIDRAFT_382440 [Calocera viscosa TUFC12733]